VARGSEEIRQLAKDACRDYEFFKAGGSLLRRSEGKVERLVWGRWVRVRSLRRERRSGWEKLNAERLGWHIRKYLIDDPGSEGATPRSSFGDWRRRSALWRFFNPPLDGGAVKRPSSALFIRSRDAYTELMTEAHTTTLSDLKYEAEQGYQHQRTRSATAEQRSTFFLGAAGLTTSLVLVNAGLLLGDESLEAPWRHLAAVALAVASICAIASGLRALQATMITFIRSPPNAVARIVKRRRLSESRRPRAYIAALLVGQQRLSVIANWKIARMKEATRWFLGAIAAVVLLTIFVLVDVAEGQEEAEVPKAGKRASVAKVAVLGEDHRHAGLLAGRDYLGVAFGAAGLDDAGGTGGDRQLGAVGEGEEGVGS
jgi:hypothetical protein